MSRQLTFSAIAAVLAMSAFTIGAANGSFAPGYQAPHLAGQAPFLGLAATR